MVVQNKLKQKAKLHHNHLHFKRFLWRFFESRSVPYVRPQPQALWAWVKPQEMLAASILTLIPSLLGLGSKVQCIYTRGVVHFVFLLVVKKSYFVHTNLVVFLFVCLCWWHCLTQQGQPGALPHTHTIQETVLKKKTKKKTTSYDGHQKNIQVNIKIPCYTLTTILERYW